MAAAQRILPDYALEQSFEAEDKAPVAGIDEAGRGPWAGPVVAAAVIFARDKIPAGLDDSKRMSAAARDAAAEEIKSCAVIGVGIAEVARIDRDNILSASLWAMSQAIRALPVTPGFALVDGLHVPDLPCPARAIVKGDSRSVSIAAASIIAKVARDAIMVDLDRIFPAYGWARNKGYGTGEHKAALQKYGPSPHHRLSFKPVRDRLAAGAC